MVKNLQDTTTLHNGVKMPWFGIGVFKVEEGPELVHAVEQPLRMAIVVLIQQLSMEMKKALDKVFVKEFKKQESPEKICS